MADSKLADLTATTTLGTTDIFYVVRDPAGTPLDRKITMSDLRTAIAVTHWSLSPSGDTYINQQATTTNYGTATTMWAGEKFDSSASFGRIILMAFDISALTSVTVLSAYLRLLRDEAAPTTSLSTTNTLVGRRLKRAFVANEATWNIYSTGNNWGTAGARAGTDVETETYQVLTTRGDRDQQIYRLDLTAMLKDALTAGDTTLRFLLGWTAATDGQNSVQFASQDNATSTKRPVLNIATIKT